LIFFLPMVSQSSLHELEGLARGERQWYKRSATGPVGAFPFTLPPIAGKGRDPVVGTVKSQRHQIAMQLL
jgi:hypothetical protein